MYNFVQGVAQKHVDAIEKINALEKRYSINFPEELKEYYSLYNGEKIILSKFDVNGYECEVAKVVPVVADKMSFESIVENDRADGFIPQNFYPLARDRGGNLYYWEANTQKVYLVFSDDYENPFKVAESIKDFFDKLK